MKSHLSAIAIAVVLGSPVGCTGDVPDVALQGVAETLWGERIDLAHLNSGTVLIQPFSPANCGYCLYDGEFVHTNYVESNAERGGQSFLQCLFNPQLDIYTYTKHFRDTTTPVITFPPELHRYHGNGFPWMMAFRDGRPLYSDGLHPYEGTFQTLKDVLWGEDAPLLTLTSSLFMAHQFAFENGSDRSVFVVADGDEAGLRAFRERVQSWRTPVPARYQGELTPEDLTRNLYLQGSTSGFDLTTLQTPDVPVRVDSVSVAIGPYRFPVQEVSVTACFPNPRNPERYVVVRLVGEVSVMPPPVGWVDYAVHRPGPDGASELLLSGLFQKDGVTWTFSPGLAFGTGSAARYCQGGVCPAPVPMDPLADRGPGVDRAPSPGAVRSDTHGTRWTLGRAGCRFPALATGPSGRPWVAWEEAGDIWLVSLGDETAPSPRPIERGPSDSFHPVLGSDGSRLWVAYLNDRDGFYRVVSRYLEGTSLSDPVLLSDVGPFDAITPAVAGGGGGDLVAVWSEWRANQRFLRYRRIESGVLGPIETALTQPVDFAYTNAWYPSLTVNAHGEVWGAWNQHYPASLGVCAGDLIEEVGSVTRVVGSIEQNENGGYPSITIDGEGTRWVFWESFGWDVLSGEPQRILGARYDEERAGWSLPQTVSADAGTFWNQTPRAAADPRAGLWVAWSGRTDASSPWGVYLAHLDGTGRSRAIRVSGDGETARAPALVLDAEGVPWIAWHSGVGSEMRVTVLRVDRAATPVPSS